MKDFFEQEIQIGDECVKCSHYISGFEKIIILETGEGKIKTIDSRENEVWTEGNEIISISALKRKLLEQMSSVLVSNIKAGAEEVVHVSLDSTKFSPRDMEEVFNCFKKAFPFSRVLVTIDSMVYVKKENE